MKKFITAFLALSVFSTLSLGATTTTLGTKTVIGKKTDTSIMRILESEQGLGTSNPRIVYDPATTKWQFRHTGVSYTDLGSGGSSGGIGYNLLDSADNAGFEAGATTWTASGGSFTAETVTPIIGTTSGKFDASALNQTLSSSSKTVPEVLKGNNCSIGISYKYGGTAGDYSLQVYDGTTVLNEKPLKVASTVKNEFVKFICPTSGTVRVRIIAAVANPGIITLDGPVNTGGLVQLGDSIPGIPKTIWDAKLVGCSGNNTTTNTSYDNFGATTGCNFTTYINSENDSVTASTTGYAAVWTPHVLARYQVCVHGAFGDSAAGYTLRLVDGSGNELKENSLVSGQGNYQEAMVCGIYDAQTSAQITVRFEMKTNNSTAIFLQNGTSWTIKEL